jgi:hypothetical protein
MKLLRFDKHRTNFTFRVYIIKLVKRVKFTLTTYNEYTERG